MNNFALYGLIIILIILGVYLNKRNTKRETQKTLLYIINNASNMNMQEVGKFTMYLVHHKISYIELDYNKAMQLLVARKNELRKVK